MGFWLVGDDYNAYVEQVVHQDHLPVGVFIQKRPYTVRVRRWAEVIEENRRRLHFYQEHLDYEAEDDLSIQETLAKYLAPVQGQGGEADKPSRKEATVWGAPAGHEQGAASTG